MNFKFITKTIKVDNISELVLLNARDKDIEIDVECCCGCVSHVFLKLEQLETITAELKKHIKEYNKGE